MTKPVKKNKPESGQVALVGIVLMVVLVVGAIGFTAWTLTRDDAPVITYTPPPVKPDDQLSAGKSSKELVQDVKILEAMAERATEYKKTALVGLNDRQLSIGTSSTTTAVEQERLSALQTDFIAECTRRIKTLGQLQSALPKLTNSQRPIVEQLVNKEITDLNGMKARVATADSQDAFDAARQMLNQEYANYLLALSQSNLLVWANDQTNAEAKYNTLGGKFQERINEASSNGKSTAEAQTALNGFQAGKATATNLTGQVVKVVPVIRAGEYGANRSVLKTYYDQLTTAHNELAKALANAKTLAIEAQKFDVR